MDKTVFSLLVDNTSGVLGRIAGMFSRRGYNIDSLTVGVTADPKYSRMTVVVAAGEDIIEQIENQLRMCGRSKNWVIRIPCAENF